MQIIQQKLKFSNSICDLFGLLMASLVKYGVLIQCHTIFNRNVLNEALQLKLNRAYLKGNTNTS